MEREYLTAPVTIVCGYYGSGKTTFSLNLARRVSGAPLTLMDMDVVNPYFRSSDYRAELEAAGVRVIAPNFAGTMLDIPSLNPAIAGILESEDRVLIDAGGDDAGATVLGCFAHLIEKRPYEMLYVINRSRPLASQPEEAAEILKAIEKTSRLRATGLVNNTHWGAGTTPRLLEESLPYAAAVSRLTGLPVKYTAVEKGLAPQVEGLEGDPAAGRLFPMDLPVQPPW